MSLYMLEHWSSVLDTLELNCEQVIAIRGNNDKRQMGGRGTPPT